ncbi:glycosyltransferase family 39 protein, partial [Candidatus Curtissbacteria bacterium]|nr:glycosyltransferase family 39 protein [Candidatus Curtissbacteria bacterium]
MNITQRVFALCLFLVAIFLLFYKLGVNSFVNWDEAYFATVARDMATRNDFVVGFFNGNPWFYEPPYLTWVLALVFKFSQSEFWLRAANAFSSLVLLLAVYATSWKLYKSYWAGFITVIILLSNIEFLFRSRQINVEVPLTLFFVASLYFLIKFKDAKKPYLVVLAAFCLALSFLTKRASPFLIIPSIGFLFFSIKPLRNFRAIILFLITLAAFVLPWVSLSFAKWGNVFIREFVINFTVGKILSSNPATGSSILFYVYSLVHSFKIWSLLIPFALVWACFKIPKNKLLGAYLIYFLAFFIFLTIAPIKASWYLVPAYPALAILVAGFVLWVSSRFVKIHLLLFVLVVGIFFAQLIRWNSSYFVPDVTREQADFSKIVGMQVPNDYVYLDDDYLPVAAYYSRKLILPLRFDRSADFAAETLVLNQSEYVMTNILNREALEKRSGLKFSVVYQNH